MKDHTEDWGVARPVGLPTATTWRNISDVTNFLYDHEDVKLFVEIGAAWGGFAALMVARSIIFPDFRYLGIELHSEDRVNENLLFFMKVRSGLQLLYDDCFAPTIVREVKHWIDTTSGKALIWCDGVDKPKEIDTYIWLLRPGDYLMVHDFSLSPDPDDDPGNASWRDIDPYLRSNVIRDCVPEYWERESGMWIGEKLV